MSCISKTQHSLTLHTSDNKKIEMEATWLASRCQFIHLSLAYTPTTKDIFLDQWNKKEVKIALRCLQSKDTAIPFENLVQMTELAKYLGSNRLYKMCKNRFAHYFSPSFEDEETAIEMVDFLNTSDLFHKYLEKEISHFFSTSFNKKNQNSQLLTARVKLCEKLTKPIFLHLKGPGVTFRHLALFKNVPLRGLRINAAPYVIGQFCNTIKNLQVEKLKTLHIVNNSCINDYTIQRISSLFPQLEEISLNNCYLITDRSCEYLSKMPLLKKVEVKNTAVTQRGLALFKNESVISSLMQESARK